MKKIDPYLKYINIILIVVIVSTIIILYVYLSRINLFYGPNLVILLLGLPCIFGGIAASLITPGIRGIFWGTLVGALSFCIWISIYMALSTFLIGTDTGSLILLIILIPLTIVIGGILGIIGGFIGFIINYSGLKGKME